MHITVTPELIDAHRQDLMAAAARSRRVDTLSTRPSGLARVFAHFHR